MKTSKTILNIAIGAMLATSATMVMAQAENVKLEGTTAIVPNAGNALERELTPALREQARKIAILENKKLDLEIEKVDLDIVKTQQESLTISNPVSLGNSMGMMGGRGNTSIPTPIDTSSLSNKPLSGVSAPQPTLTQTSASVAQKKENLNGEAIDNSDRTIRVLMIGGNEGNLKAKIMYKRQGGYSVGQGDTLPNGKKVVRVDPQFIEVIHPKGKTKTKIYVAGYPTEAEERAFSLNGGYSENNVTDSATPPAAMPGMANSVPTPFGVPIAGIPTITTPALGTGRLTPMAGGNRLTPGQVR